MYRLRISAFVTSASSEDALRAAMTDISLVRSCIEITHGGITAAVARHAVEECASDLLVVQSDDDEAHLRSGLDELSAHVSAGTQIVVIGRVDSIDFYRSMIDVGVGQYLLTPLTAPAFMRAVKDVYGNERASSRGRTVAVVGSTGGVGASTVAHNLGWSLADLHAKPVSLVDLDIHFGTAGINYNHEARFGLRDALQQASAMGLIEESFLEKLFSKESDTLWLLASSPSLADSSALLTADALEAVLDAVARMSDFVVLDVPHVWTTPFAQALLVADEVVIVTEPSLHGLRNTQAMFETLGPGKPQGTLLRYVINNSGLDRASEITSKEFAEAVGSAPMQTMTWMPSAFRAAGMSGRMVSEGKKNAKVAAVFRDMARSVSGPQVETPASKKKIGARPGRRLLPSLRKVPSKGSTA